MDVSTGNFFFRPDITVQGYSNLMPLASKNIFVVGQVFHQDFRLDRPEKYLYNSDHKWMVKFCKPYNCGYFDIPHRNYKRYYPVTPEEFCQSIEGGLCTQAYVPRSLPFSVYFAAKGDECFTILLDSFPKDLVLLILSYLRRVRVQLQDQVVLCPKSPHGELINGEVSLYTVQACSGHELSLLYTGNVISPKPSDFKQGILHYNPTRLRPAVRTPEHVVVSLKDVYVCKEEPAAVNRKRKAILFE